MSDYSDEYDSDDENINIVSAGRSSDYSSECHSDDETKLNDYIPEETTSDESYDEAEIINYKLDETISGHFDYSNDEPKPANNKSAETVNNNQYNNRMLVIPEDDEMFIEKCDDLIYHSSEENIPPIVERLISFFKDGNKSEYSKQAIHIFLNNYIIYSEDYKRNPVIFGTLIDLIKDSSDWKQQKEAIIGFIDGFDNTYDPNVVRDKSLEYSEEYKKIVMDNIKVLYDAVSNIVNHLQTEYEIDPKEFKHKYSSMIREFYEALPKILRRKRLKKLYRLFVRKEWW